MDADKQLVPAGPLTTDEKAREMASPGAPPEEVERIKALMSQPDEVRITPIKIVYDSRFGIGVFISGSLLDFAACQGPYFNGPDLPTLKITNLEEFVRAVGKELLRPAADETILIGRCIDDAILAAVSNAQANGPSEFLECTPATTTNSDSSPAPEAVA